MFSSPNFWFVCCSFVVLLQDTLTRERDQLKTDLLQSKTDLLQLTKENHEIDKQRMMAIKQSYPLACRGALETIWADFRDRHQTLPGCGNMPSSASAFFQHWLSCSHVHFDQNDCVNQLLDSRGVVVIQSNKVNILREIPTIYNTLSALIHVPVLPTSESMIIPKDLNGDQACALATVLRRHYFQNFVFET